MNTLEHLAFRFPEKFPLSADKAKELLDAELNKVMGKGFVERMTVNQLFAAFSALVMLQYDGSELAESTAATYAKAISRKEHIHDYLHPELAAMVKNANRGVYPE
jgi:hypothetical protein